MPASLAVSLHASVQSIGTNGSPVELLSTRPSLELLLDSELLATAVVELSLLELPLVPPSVPSPALASSLHAEAVSTRSSDATGRDIARDTRTAGRCRHTGTPGSRARSRGARRAASAGRRARALPASGRRPPCG